MEKWRKQERSTVIGWAAGQGSSVFLVSFADEIIKESRQ
ncbi:hypothetical protein SD77_3924 [Bacillus badius]|uniref:Uncharacterized protein n=1 Tax=Bacillus badius TaxID=1455 RepID=A0ABR5AX71_BACBA|nr:hypothetical protein SD77_3924 [Bacillus badius]